MSIEKTIEVRANRYGSFDDNAITSQRIKKIMRNSRNWEYFSDAQKESLEMIAHKLARILIGDPSYHDSWHDIEGYARLISQELIKENE